MMASVDRRTLWRAKKDAEITFLTTELNAKRAQLNLPPVSFTLEHSVPFKGGKRPCYNPPEELTKLQLRQWRLEEKKKRKAMKQSENRKRKAALLKEMKEQLSELNKMLEVKMNHESTVRPCNQTEESIEVDPYIENLVDSAPWIYGEIVASGDEIVHVFDNEVEGTD
jgi:hypothetical protein